MLDRVEQAMSYTGNYNLYRAKLADCCAKGIPAVPLLGNLYNSSSLNCCITSFALQD